MSMCSPHVALRTVPDADSTASRSLHCWRLPTFLLTYVPITIATCCVLCVLAVNMNMQLRFSSLTTYTVTYYVMEYLHVYGKQVSHGKGVLPAGSSYFNSMVTQSEMD